ncbi:MAG: redox-sensing transcriptional repressor Rex [Pseudoflavonifractor sp.]|nr:redox-sensing transcriptional repressor Rex [Pseudoflavonifractor sp.]
MSELKPRDLIPEPTLSRLPWYLAYVSMLRSQGVGHVSSTRISREIDVDASRIAKDLSFLNIKGKTRIGYDVVELERELADFLGFKVSHNAIIAGVGSLGAALMRDSGLSRYGLNIVAGFDISPMVIGHEIGGIPVYDIGSLADVRPKVDAEIGIITVPVDRAQTVADMMIEAGIKALWNFTPYRIRSPRDVVIQDTSIYAHLAVMYNRLQSRATKPTER